MKHTHFLIAILMVVFTFSFSAPGSRNKKMHPEFEVALPLPFMGVCADSVASAPWEVLHQEQMLLEAEAKNPIRNTPLSPTRQTSLIAEGRQLFIMNCAHCHAKDGHGDEGPDLHHVTKSDSRIAAMIKNGVKGEMPNFGAKLTDRDVQALIAYIRSLD